MQLDDDDLLGPQIATAPAPTFRRPVSISSIPNHDPNAAEIQALIDAVTGDDDLLGFIRSAIADQPVEFWKRHAPWQTDDIAERVRRKDGPALLRKMVAEAIAR